MRPCSRTRPRTGWGDFQITWHSSLAPKGREPVRQVSRTARLWLCGRSSRGSRPCCCSACQTFLAFDSGQLRGAAGRNAYRWQAIHRGSIDEPAGELSDHALLGCHSAGCGSTRSSANSGRGDRDNDSRKQCVCNADTLAGKPAIGTDVYECKWCVHLSLRVNLVNPIGLVRLQAQR
jgi:hypothetical protein